MKTAHDRLLQTETGKRELCVELTITNVTELIAQRLEESGMNRSDLASAMGVTPGRVTQMLDGESNLTLRSIALALAAFGHIMTVDSDPIASNVAEHGWMRREEIASFQRPHDFTFTQQPERAVAEFFATSEFEPYQFQEGLYQ